MEVGKQRQNSNIDTGDNLLDTPSIVYECQNQDIVTNYITHKIMNVTKNKTPEAQETKNTHTITPGQSVEVAKATLKRMFGRVEDDNNTSLLVDTKIISNNNCQSTNVHYSMSITTQMIMRIK